MPTTYREWRDVLARIPDDVLIDAHATPTLNADLARALKHEMRARDLM